MFKFKKIINVDKKLYLYNRFFMSSQNLTTEHVIIGTCVTINFIQLDTSNTQFQTKYISSASLQ